MSYLQAEVRDLINVNERIQSALLGGKAFSEDEQELIKMIGRELLGLPVWSHALPNYALDVARRGVYTDHALTDSPTVE